MLIIHEVKIPGLGTIGCTTINNEMMFLVNEIAELLERPDDFVRNKCKHVHKIEHGLKVIPFSDLYRVLVAYKPEFSEFLFDKVLVCEDVQDIIEDLLKEEGFGK